jgi:DNA repair exonuclease SbcCD ATPase subunit
MVKLERLRLRAFRGVPGELQLDFTSPLTIIYAPNGTGKSSVIDAAEWLLTGDVKRVSGLGKKGGATELRCKFAPMTSRMEVEGWFSRGEGAIRLLRLPEAWSMFQEGDDTPRRTTGQEVMGIFAPDEVPEESDYRAAPGLERDWIRSARFLTVSTLAFLADTESENQATREAALGGLLGVGELFARADKFETFAMRLNEGYGGEEGLAATRKELARRKEELARLRKGIADTGCNPHDLNGPAQGELSALLLILDEKEETHSREARLSSALDSLFRQRQLHELEEVVGTIEEKVSRIERKRDQALEAAGLFREKANGYCAEQLDRLFDVAYPIFSRVQANEVFDSLHRGPLKNPFDWVAKSSIHAFTPSPHFSMGQRQDLALAIFLARARGINGTFFLDEPVLHLDDLNRVALMDTFRMLVLESGPHCNFVMTTARRDFVRHMAEKFVNVPTVHGMPPLRIYELDGTPRDGVRAAKEWCGGGETRNGP